MDKLWECAKNFERLLSIRYHIVVGRKAKAVELRIGFESEEFHHLIGLHKLRDLRVARENRGQVFKDILAGKIELSDIEKSRYYPIIKNRIEPFMAIEKIFDENKLVFRYNEKKQEFSMIQAEYLLSTLHEEADVYIFLDERAAKTGEFFCRSFFPKEDKDYTIGQAKYTLLFKEKIFSATGEHKIQYDRLHL